MAAGVATSTWCSHYHHCWLIVCALRSLLLLVPCPWWLLFLLLYQSRTLLYQSVCRWLQVNALEPTLAHIRFLAYYDELYSYLVLVPQTATGVSTIYCTPNSIYCTKPRGSRTWAWWSVQFAISTSSDVRWWPHWPPQQDATPRTPKMWTNVRPRRTPALGGTRQGHSVSTTIFHKNSNAVASLATKAVLPNASDVNDTVVPAEWRPLQCVQRDFCVDFICHEDASCKVNSNNTPVCTCNDNLVGDGITSCAPPPRAVPAKNPPYVCQSDSYCNMKLENSLCIAGDLYLQEGLLPK